MVLSAIRFVANPNVALVEQGNRYGDYFSLAELTLTEIALHSRSQIHQPLAKFPHSFKLGYTPEFDPFRMVAVLLPVARVASRSL
jgi:hypothetical protein